MFQGRGIRSEATLSRTNRSGSGVNRECGALRLFLLGQHDAKNGAASLSAGHGELPTMGFHNAPAGGQAKADAGNGMAGLAAALKWLENPFPLVGRHPDT